MKKVILIGIIALFTVSGCTLKLTKEPNAQTDSISFAVIGDNEGINEHFASLMQSIASDPSIQFVIHVGDVTATGSEKEIAEIEHFKTTLPRDIPWYAVPGNHDIKEDPETTRFQETFGQVPRSVDIKNIHLILLDNSNRKVGFDEQNLSWLEQDLKNAAGKTIIIAFHRPFGYPLAASLGDDETTASRKTNERFRELLKPYDISYIFTGHIHTNLEFPFVVERNEENLPTKSIPVVVSGGGGQPPQDIFSTLFSPDYHYLKVTLRENSFEIEKQSEGN